MTSNENRLFKAPVLFPVTASLMFLLPGVITMFVFSPLCIALSLAGAMLSSLIYAGSKTFSVLKMSLFLLPVITVFNFLFSHLGSTVLFELFGINFTLESLLYGLVTSCMIAAVSLWICAFSGACGNSGVMYMFSRALPSFCMLTTLTSRCITVMRHRANSVREASSAFARKKGLRSLLDELTTVFMWSMEDSIVTADSMRARGYDAEGVKRTTASVCRFKIFDAFLCVLCVLITGLCLIGVFKGVYSADIFKDGAIPSLLPKDTLFTLLLALYMLFPTLVTLFKHSGGIIKCLK